LHNGNNVYFYCDDNIEEAMKKLTKYSTSIPHLDEATHAKRGFKTQESAFKNALQYFPDEKIKTRKINREWEWYLTIK